MKKALTVSLPLWSLFLIGLIILILVCAWLFWPAPVNPDQAFLTQLRIEDVESACFNILPRRSLTQEELQRLVNALNDIQLGQQWNINPIGGMTHIRITTKDGAETMISFSASGSFNGSQLRSDYFYCINGRYYLIGTDPEPLPEPYLVLEKLINDEWDAYVRAQSQTP